MDRTFDLLQINIHYSFQNLQLLREALTHASYANEHVNEDSDNERLEFLGDSVLSAIISKQLYEKGLPEGQMTRVRSLTVRSESLAEIADSIHLSESIRFGQGEKKSGGKSKQSNKEDALEALIGAIFLDGGYRAAENFVLEFFSDTLNRAMGGKLVYDYKSQLYELLQSKESNPDIQFILVAEEGPAHSRSFTYAVSYKGKVYDQATAPSKKAAEQEAARLFLAEFNGN